MNDVIYLLAQVSYWWLRWDDLKTGALFDLQHYMFLAIVSFHLCARHCT
jgi:hypothetical protein